MRFPTYLVAGMILLAAAGTASAWIGIAPPSKEQIQAELLSIQEFTDQIEKCRASGGRPTPIYDKADPSRIYRLDCEKLASPMPVQAGDGGTDVAIPK